MERLFISYTAADEEWAKWIARVLQDAGYEVILQAGDFRPGHNFVLKMQDGSASADRTIAILSPDYLRSRFGRAEWAAAFASDPTGERRALIPVRVREVELEGLFSPIIYIDLVGKEEEAARTALLEGLLERCPSPGPTDSRGGRGDGRATEAEPPPFPGSRPRGGCPKDTGSEEFRRIPAASAPYDRSWYVHREEEERRAHGYLEHPGRPVVIHGPRKSGKSWLLGHLVERTCERIPLTKAVRINLSRLDDSSFDCLDTLLQRLARQLLEDLKVRNTDEVLTKNWRRDGDSKGKLSKLSSAKKIEGIEGAGDQEK